MCWVCLSVQRTVPLQVHLTTSAHGSVISLPSTQWSEVTSLLLSSSHHYEKQQSTKWCTQLAIAIGLYHCVSLLPYIAMAFNSSLYFIIWLEDRLPPNIGFTLRRVLAVFTRSATPPKVNRFGWNLEHSEYIIGGWPWQILGAIDPRARWKFLSGKQRTRPISPISRRPNFTKFEHNTTMNVAMTNCGTEFWKYRCEKSFFQKK